MGKLGVLRPDDIPHATDYVDQMVEMISTLVQRDAAYVTDDGVYLNVKSVPDYGLLAHQSLDDMLSGGGDREVLGASNKKNPADFALWKFSKPGEPSWSAPWGEGRPGWHSECVVMSLELLGEDFDLHCGGADLRFPHHENERAQSNAAINSEAVALWVHGEHLLFEGRKMAKSTGNVVLVSDLIAKHLDPLALRLCFLENRYRSQMDLSWDSLKAAHLLIQRWREKTAVWRLAKVTDTKPAVSFIDEIINDFTTDLDTPRALQKLRSIEKAQTLSDGVKLEIFKVVDPLFGLDLLKPAVVKSQLPQELQKLLDARSVARSTGDFVESDRLRDLLAKDGIVVRDSKDGQSWDYLI